MTFPFQNGIKAGFSLSVCPPIPLMYFS